MPLRLLCITAHPDDEAGGFAGALLHAHAAGVETRVLCLTEGRAASNRGEAKSDEELGAMRRGEFAEACRILKVTHGEVLDYPDGDLLHLNFYAVVSMLVEYIRRYRPQVVLTFGGDGGPNIHRDHTMAGLFATAAFHWSGRSFFAPEHFEVAPDGPGLSPYAPQKLYYPSTSFIVSKWKEEAEAAPKTPTSLVLEMGEFKEMKAQAVEVHSSQAVMERAREVYEKFGHEERYLLVAARDPDLIGKEHSMFEGVIED